jgi:broad specificity phosphatase PhoE
VRSAVESWCAPRNPDCEGVGPVSRPRRLKVIVEADGGARGNPGPAGYGAVVYEAATGEVLVGRAEPLGTATNNVAEYSGLIAGLQAAADLGAVDVEVRMDSKLVVEQMSGRWQIKNPGLRPLAAQAATLARRFDRIRFTWIPRDQNRRADALANAAMDGKLAEDVELPDPPRATPEAGLAAGPRSWAPPSTGSATRLVLVRHGETELTAQQRYSGRGDVPLSHKGHLQAAAAAARVTTMVSEAWTRPAGPASGSRAESLVKVAAVVSSPLARCLATAERIAADTNSLPVRVVPDLIECDFGQWEGLTFSEVRERWPDQLDDWLDSTAMAPPGGESFQAVAVRVRAAVSGLLSEYAGQTVVVVSHVTPLKLTLRDALASGDALLHRLFLDPAGISIVDTWPDGGVAVRSINETGHLTAI